jgi:DNA-binding transcriptional ArsR family regulator
MSATIRSSEARLAETAVAPARDAASAFAQPQQAELIAAMQHAAEEAADLLRAIGSPHRLMILCLLTERERTVTEICDTLGARQSLTSQHLTRLRLDGLVKAERRGHYAYYSLTDSPAKAIVAVLYQHFCAKGMIPPEKP